MVRNLLVVCSIVMALGCFISPVTSFAETYEIQIDVAPNVLNIESKSEVVTVHTDIACDDVAGSTVTLNGVAISSWKSDDRGNFVAKFLSEEIKALQGIRIDEYNALTLIGCDLSGDTFIGSQDIRVIEVFSQGRQ